MSGWVFIIDKRCPDPRLMSGQIHLRNSTFYFYDLQKVGLSSSKAARLKVGHLCGKSRSQRYVFYVETDTYTLSFALCLHHSQILNFNVGMKCLCSRAAHRIPETMKQGKKNSLSTAALIVTVCICSKRTFFCNCNCSLLTDKQNMDVRFIRSRL